MSNRALGDFATILTSLINHEDIGEQHLCKNITNVNKKFTFSFLRFGLRRYSVASEETVKCAKTGAADARNFSTKDCWYLFVKTEFWAFPSAKLNASNARVPNINTGCDMTFRWLA